MAKLLGRHKTPCLSCGFEHVHIKSNEGKHPYLHCPECGLVVPTRNGRQAAGMMAGLRPEKHQDAPKLQAGNPPELERRPDDIVLAAAPDASRSPETSTPPTPPKKKSAPWCTLIGAQS